MTNEMSKIDYICATTDAWSVASKNYIGVTVHFFLPDMSRRGYVLAIRRVHGSHTFTRIKDELRAIFDEYGITQKIVGVVTDNGANYVKCFKYFGTLGVKPPPPAFPGEEAVDPEVYLVDPDDEEDDLVAGERHTEVESGDELEDELVERTSDIPQARPRHPLWAPIPLNEGSVFPIARPHVPPQYYRFDQRKELPPHYRCAAHTLSLVCSTDAADCNTHGSPFFNSHYNSGYQNVFPKLKKLWNKQSQSPLEAGRIYACLLYTSPSPRDKRQSRMPSSA